MIPAPVLLIAKAAGGFLVEYWRILAVVGIVGLSYVKGCSDEKERFDAYKDQLAAAGEAHEKWAARYRASQKAITRGKELDHEARIAALRGSNSDLARQLLSATGSVRVVSIVPKPAPGGTDPGQVCFDQAQLDARILAAVERLRASRETLLRGALGILQRGDETGQALITYDMWTDEQRALSRDSRQPLLDTPRN